jgi:uncharacterized protein involved in outer membrane biogenesis
MDFRERFQNRFPSQDEQREPSPPLHRGGSFSLPALNMRVITLLAAGLAGLAILWVAVVLIVFSADSVREKTLAAMERSLGRKVNFAGEPQFTYFPSPVMVLRNVNIENSKAATSPSLLRGATVTVSVSLASLVQSGLIVALTIENPELEFEVLRDGSGSWESPPAPLSVDGLQEAALISEINIKNASIHYEYPAVHREITIQGLNGQLEFSSADQMEASGAVQLAEMPYQFSLGGSGLTTDTKQIAFSLGDSSNQFTLEGNWNSKLKSFQGKQSFRSQDLGELLQRVLQRSGAGESPQASPAKPFAAMPLEGTSRLDYQGDVLSIKDIILTRGALQGNGTITAEMAAQPVVNSRFEMEKFSLDPLVERGIINALLTQSNKTEIVKGFSVDLPESYQTALPQGITVNTILTSREAQILSLPITDMQMSATLQDAKILFSQFSGKTEGEGQFIIKGEMEGSVDGAAFKGQIDVGGAEFDKVAARIFGENLTIPASLKQFRGRANLFLTPTSIRLSESILRVGNFQLLGTLLRQTQKTVDRLKRQAWQSGVGGTNDTPQEQKHPDAAIRYEGTLRLDNLNLDEWEAAQKDPAMTALDGYPKLVRLAKQWQGMAAAADSGFNLRLSLQDATIGGMPSSRTNMQFWLGSDGVALTQMNLPYRTTLLSGDAAILFPPNAPPMITGDLRADILNTGVFFDHDFSKDENFWRDSNGLWSKKEFNLEWFRRLNTHFKLQVGSLIHEAYTLKDFETEIGIKDAVVQIPRFSATIWGGKFALRGMIQATKIPSFATKLSIDGISIEQVRSTTDLVGDLIGKISLTSEASMSGINPFSAIQTMQGAVAVAGQNITMKGFNLTNLVRAANTVRTVEDTKKLLQFAEQGGTTDIDAIQGQANIGSGYLRSPGIQIHTKEGNGIINGQLNLMDWDLNTAIVVYLTALNQTNPPFLRVVSSGKLNQSTRHLDTQSLESYIAKQATERILDTR